MDLKNNYTPPVKLKKPFDKVNANDVYCFECHHEGDLINCDSCPRSYHLKCLSLTTLPQKNWTCPECETTQSSFYIINQRYSINELHIMLKHALHRLKSHHQAEYFLKSIDSNQNSDYYDYIIHPMDFQIIEKHLNLKKYSSTEAFLGDIKWILHNSYIYNGNQSKLTHIARTLLKNARHEMSDIEICPDCYLRTSQPLTTDWFTKPCTIPHVLCWAKMKTYQSWPAKVLRIVNNEVDVRFFGQHDRAWISYNNCFVLSKEYPEKEKKKSNRSFDNSFAELQIHIDQLKKLYGYFTYAPPQTLLNKTKPFKFVSIIDDSILPSYMTAGNNSSKFRSRRHRSSSINSTDKCSNKNINDKSPKRLRTSSNQTDDESQSTLNVFDIFNQSDQSILNDHQIRSNSSRFRPTSPTDNKYLIQGLLRRYTHWHSSTVESINPDVRLSMNALLDAAEALQTVSEVHANASNETPEQQNPRRKKPRKSNLQHRIIPSPSPSNFFTSPSLDQYLSPTLPFVPLRPLSVSPPSVENFQAAPLEINDDIIPDLSFKSEEEEPQSSISINSFLISPSIDETIPTIIPSLLPIPSQQNIWQSTLSVDPPRKQSKKTRNERLRSSSSHNQSSDTPSIPHQTSTRTLLHTNEIPSDDHQIRGEIQTIVNNFNDQFQHLLVDLTSQIDSSLLTTRMKYEKDLEEIRRSYRLSLNDLHSITTEQVQEIHNSLELQYWKRLSEMRNRYESKLNYSLPLN